MAHSGPKSPHPDTLAVHAGQSPDPATGARAVPIYQTASYVLPDTDTAAALFNMELPGHVYSRLSNPTVAVFEERMAALEGGVAALATASGQAALVLAVLTLMGKGGHVVASASLYGGSHNLLAYTLPRAIGYQRASDILLTNREVSADEAHAMGLVARLVEPEALMATTMEVARALAAGPTVSLGLTKRLLRRAY